MNWCAMMLQAQRGALFPWVPVCLGVGIALFFAQDVEPSVTKLRGLAVSALGVFAVAFWVRGSAAALVLTGVAVGLSGFVLAGVRAHHVAEPVLSWRYYGPVEGRVVALDRSASDAVRVTLDQVRMARISPERMPARVRISLHGDAATEGAPTPGAWVMTTAHISPPGGPVEPGGFDFQRHSWFLRLGGVGYTRVPLMTRGPPDPGLALLVFRMRMAVSSYVRETLPGDVGGFAAAVTAGDRSGISQEALTHLRASNLAHLLAISGLHMGLLTGFVYSVLRFGLVLIPGAALLYPVRAMAAAVALIAGAGYLALSGGNVATERAFVMAAVALCAVMLNRRVFSLRGVAIAALVVLVLRPEALLGPGFQMSFAATTALVAVFNALRDGPLSLPRWLRPVSAVVISSGVAGLATAPIAAAHFNAIAHYGLLANVVSVPVMGALIVPAAVVAAGLAPFGLAPLALKVAGLGLWWILEVADRIANLPGARSFVVSPGVWVLPCLTLGFLTVILWQGRLRWVGVAPALLAFALWSVQERPTILIADGGALVGVMTPEGRALSKARGAGFVAQNWLENDGDGADQDHAHARWIDVWPDGAAKRVSHARVDTLPIWHLSGKVAARDPPDCAFGVLVANQPLGVESSSCEVFDPKTLRATGAIALHLMSDGGFKLTTARQLAGDRMWSQWPTHATPARDQYVRINPTKRP